MAKENLPSIEKLLEAGAHLGHLRGKWNPKMKPFIFGIRNNVHMINLEKTIECLKTAKEFIEKLISENKTILFVGAKKQAKEAVKKTAKNLNMPYIDYRWLGGTLTNFETVQKALKTFKKLEEQKNDKEFFDAMTKKEQKNFMVKLEKMDKSFGGMKNMNSLPDALFVIDTVEEKVAVNEAIKYDIPIIATVDSNSDPTKIAYPIPLNDDSKLAIQIVFDYISDITKKSVEKKIETKKEEVKTK